MSETQDRWLSQRVEVAINPERRIVDPHHHLWDRAGDRYCAEELAADTGASHNVTHTVFVECSAEYDDAATAAMAPVGETRFVVQQAARAAGLGESAIAGIVGHADLMLGAEVRPVLEAHVEAGAGLFRGIRHGTNWSRHESVKNGHHGPAAHQMADSRFRDGVRVLGELGLRFDAWLYFDQLVELAAMAAACPGTAIVLDHLGGPLGIGPHAGDGRAEMLEEWRRGIELVAEQPNVVCKVGGIGMEHYFGMGWRDQAVPPSSEQAAEHWADIVHTAIDAFGPDRCMFESNFPVDRQTLSYTTLWNALQILGSRYTAAEQDDLFFGTAWRHYALGSDDA